MNVEELGVLAEGSTLDTDVCIVGSGPAGLTLARELNGSGAKVLVLESGGREWEAASDALNVVENVGRARRMDQALVRNRVFGGSGTLWQGRLGTFDEIDFAARSWVPLSGWPFSRAELEPYFARTIAHLGSAFADNNDPRAVELVAARYPRLNEHLLRQYVWSYARHDPPSSDFMRFGARALTSRLDDVTCFVHATVTHIDTTETGDAVRALEVCGADGRLRRVRARVVVLCAGGIENARILLASRRIVNCGVGNAHDVVGRYLMDHPKGAVARFEDADALAAQRLFGEFRLKPTTLARTGAPASATARSVRLVPGWALSPALQESEQLVNGALFVVADVVEGDPLLAAYELAARRQPLRNAARVLGQPRMAAEGLRRVALKERLAVRRVSDLWLTCILEQRPDPDSRITLSAQTDANGVPRAVIDWRISEQEALTARRATELFTGELERLGLPVPVPLAIVTTDRTEFHLSDAAHPTGTTRMSLDPRTGVVDGDHAVHGVAGLYVAGSSVFPTSGHANPTQMIVATTIRLADRLKATLGAQRRSAGAVGVEA